MKTISELQQDIRTMQTELKSINMRLSEINDELLNYKDSGISDSAYIKIYEIAETMPIIEHPIINYSYAVKNNYFAILVFIATCEDSINDNQLLFLQRMAMADSQRTSIDLYLEGIGSVSAENIIFKINENIKNELAYQLILDMLVIANLCVVKTRKTYEIIANISSFLGMQREDMEWVSQVASAILKQNLMDIRKNEFEQAVEIILFEYYLKEIPGWGELLKSTKEQKQKLELIGKFVSILKVKCTANSEIYEYIADMAAILGIPTESIKDLALVAKLTLNQILVK